VSTNIAIKGTRNGLLLTLQPQIPFNELLSALAARLAESPTFFRGASLTVDTTHRNLRKSERKQIEALLLDYQMSLTSVEDVAKVRRGARTVALAESNLEPVLEERLMKEKEPSHLPFPVQTTSFATPFPTEANESRETRDLRDLRASEDTLFLRRTVRSGQAIHHPSNVVVLGDVNPGAEIVAGGDIIVWGVLRGMVHAGYPDNDSAVVCALQLAPVQLRVAHLLSRPPEDFEAQPRPEVAAIRQGQIVVETWVSGRPPRK
jgi:septum site-determining protein MinC